MPTSPIEGFCDHIDRCSSRVAKVTLSHREYEDGMRTRIQLFDASDTEIDVWEDSSINGRDVLHVLRNRWASVEQNGAGYVHTFTVRIPRRRARDEARA